MGNHARLLVVSRGSARSTAAPTGLCAAAGGVGDHGATTAARRGSASATGSWLFLGGGKLALGRQAARVDARALGSTTSRLGVGAGTLGARAAPMALPPWPLARAVTVSFPVAEHASRGPSTAGGEVGKEAQFLTAQSRIFPISGSPGQ